MCPLWRLDSRFEPTPFLLLLAANAFNQVMERANDLRMKRTMRRPLPSGRLTPLHAASFATALGLGGLGLLAAGTNETTAALGAANIALYTLVYTPLKGRGRLACPGRALVPQQPTG